MGVRSTRDHSVSSSGSSGRRGPVLPPDSLLGRICTWPPSFPQGIDLVLLFLVLGLVVFGLVMVYSASFIYAQERTGDGFAFIKKQVTVAFVGFLVLWATCRVPYRKWGDLAYPILGVAILALGLVLIPGIGTRVGGAQRWINLGFFNFQPAEFAKFAMIIFMAKLLERKSGMLQTWRAGIVSPLLLSLPVLSLLLLQPDFGSTVLITLVVFAMLFLSGVSLKNLALVVLPAVAAGAALILGSEYRRARLASFLDPWSDPEGKGFQILQSLVGLHQGQVFGAGLGNGKEKLFYLPEAHNDFIFAVIGEELGFLGVCAVAGAYLYLLYRGLRIGWNAYERYGDRFALLLASGITLALGLQGFVNMGVVLGLLPTKGLTLPFISYGGSALLVDLFAVGVLLSIARGPQHR